MKLKTLIPFVVVLLALGGLVMFKNLQKQPESIVEQSGLQEVAPADISADSIKRIELHTGAAPEEKVTLAREGEQWVVASNFNAPVKKDLIEDYLDKLTSVRGEARLTAKDEAGLDTYKLKEADAFHVKAYTEGDTPALHVLVGKAPDFRSVFFRKAGDMTVYVERNNLRSEAGVSGDDMTTKPTADKWLDKDIVKLEEDKVTKLAYTMPDKSLTLEQREVPAEAPPAEEAEKKEGEAATPPATKKEWHASAGGIAPEVKQDGVTKLLGRFKTLAASNIVDPAKKAELGMDNPPFKLVISRGDEGDITLLGAHKDTAGPGHLMIEGGNGMIYEVSKFLFENIFVKGGEFYDLPKVELTVDKVAKVEISGPEGSAVLVKEGDQWTAQEPALPFSLDQEKIKTLVSTAAALQFKDYADNPQPYTHSVTLHADGITRTIQGGGPTPGYEGAYAGIDGDTRTYTVNKTEAEALFIAPRDLMSLDAFNTQATDIRSIALGHEGKKVQLTNAETDWMVSVDGGAPFTGDKERITGLTAMLADLTYTNVHTGGRAADWQPLMTVEFTTAAGESHKLNISPAEGEKHLVQTDGGASLFELDVDNVNTFKYHFNNVQTPPDPAAAEAAPADAAVSLGDMPAGHPPIPTLPDPSLPPAQTIEIPAPGQ